MVFGLKKHGPDGRYGAIVDVGSGSVGVAIMVSDSLEKNPKVIWSYRERMLIRNHVTLADSEKQMTTTILNAMLELGNSGLRKLNEYETGAKVGLIKVAVAAPWSYTVTRTITVNDENPFSVTKKLILEMSKKAQKQTEEALSTGKIEATLGVSLTHRATIGITANGYRVHNPEGSEVRKLTLTELSSVISTNLVKSINETAEKILPEVPVTIQSFMYTFYLALTEMHPDTSEVCLVDVTSEATEIGVVRDGLLEHTTHIPYGQYSLARDLSNLCKLPKEEALAYLRSNGVDNTQNLTEDGKREVTVIVNNYVEGLVRLFHETGDSLSIPKTIFLHTDKFTEDFYSLRLKEAGKLATKGSHAVHPITSEFLNNENIDDTALLLSGYVFHKNLYDLNYLED